MKRLLRQARLWPGPVFCASRLWDSMIVYACMHCTCPAWSHAARCCTRAHHAAAASTQANPTHYYLIVSPITLPPPRVLLRVVMFRSNSSVSDCRLLVTMT